MWVHARGFKQIVGLNEGKTVVVTKDMHGKRKIGQAAKRTCKS